MAHIHGGSVRYVIDNRGRGHDNRPHTPTKGYQVTKEQLAKAFIKGANGSCRNATSNGSDYSLHGKVICTRSVSADGRFVYFAFNWCGWHTPTTASHMNEILRSLGHQLRVSDAMARDGQSPTTFIEAVYAHKLLNIEPSRYTPGAYVGYGGGAVWTITGGCDDGHGNKWLAIPRQADSPEHIKHLRLRTRTLTDMSIQLQQWS